MPKLDPERARVREGPGYAGPLAVVGAGIRRVKLHEQAGLTSFGGNVLTLPPGKWSSQRHWHHAHDEFVWVISGEVVLVTEGRETVLRAGDCAGFRAGDPDGHHLQNRSDRDATILEIGSRRADDVVDYPDLDAFANADGMFHRDGRPFRVS